MKRGGFTLLELLVAMAVFAVVGVMAYGGLSTVLKQQQVAENQADRWQDIQFTFRVVSRDLYQVHPRPVRQELGDSYSPAISADARSPYLLEFTRGGWPNPAGSPRSTLQRVAYLLDGDELVRLQWPVLDRTLATQPLRTVLMDRVDDVQLRFLDTDGQWVDQWPPGAAGAVQPGGVDQRPRAVEFTVDTPDYDRIWRLVEVAP